jgi:hypothetical protein
MINVIKRMIENNSDFGENDAFIFISLEDDQNKIYKRLLSIFGNYGSKTVKLLFKQASDLLRNNQLNNGYVNSGIQDKITSLFEEITVNSLIDITRGKIKFITKYFGENQCSSGDVSRMLDSLIFQGVKPRALFIDYVDLMIPTNSNSRSASEYEKQGTIMHELRQASRNYSIPIITITQNVRNSEDSNNELGNGHLADSFRKARYADCIIMVRQRPEFDILNEAVASDLLIDENLNFSNIPTEYLKTLIPFEIKITKSKDGEKNLKKFHMFSFINLRIYQNIQEFTSDIEISKTKSDLLESKVNIIGLNNDDVNITSDEDDIENLLV